jgi:hypothetical protein
MTHRSRARLLSFVLAVVVAGASPAVAAAGPGFVVPSRNTTCGLLTAEQTGSSRPGLYCSSSYIEEGAYDGMGAVRLNRTGKARRIGGGNDLHLAIAGVNRDGTQQKRPVLRYGKTWKQSGYRCISRSSGLTCRRGSTHGFFLSREKQRYF